MLSAAKYTVGTIVANTERIPTRMIVWCVYRTENLTLRYNRPAFVQCPMSEDCRGGHEMRQLIPPHSDSNGQERPERVQ